MMLTVTTSRSRVKKPSFISGTRCRELERTSLANRFVKTVEDEPLGYPRFSAFVASHPSFQIYRRYCGLRTRLLLYEQDRLWVLEKKLRKLDKKDTGELCLGSRRNDNNAERRAVVSEIKEVLADYGW